MDVGKEYPAMFPEPARNGSHAAPSTNGVHLPPPENKTPRRWKRSANGPRPFDIMREFEAAAIEADLKPSDRHVWTGLWKHRDVKTGLSRISHGILAEKTGYQRRSVIRILNRLVGLGFVEIARSGGSRGWKSNVYRLVANPSPRKST